MDLLLVTCPVLIGAVFAVAAFTKLRSSADLRPFASILMMVPERLRLPVGGVVAKSEAATAALMAIPGTRAGPQPDHARRIQSDDRCHRPAGHVSVLPLFRPVRGLARLGVPDAERPAVARGGVRRDGADLHERAAGRGAGGGNASRAGGTAVLVDFDDVAELFMDRMGRV